MADLKPNYFFFEDASPSGDGEPSPGLSKRARDRGVTERAYELAGDLILETRSLPVALYALAAVVRRWGDEVRVGGEPSDRKGGQVMRAAAERVSRLGRELRREHMDWLG
jgi:hypothetical protein